MIWRRAEQPRSWTSLRIRSHNGTASETELGEAKKPPLIRAIEQHLRHRQTDNLL